MPPWPIDDTCGGPFIGSFHLTQAEIDTFTGWAAQGAPAGDPADAPQPSNPEPALTTASTSLQRQRPLHTDGVKRHRRLPLLRVLEPMRSPPDQNVIAYEIDPGVTAEVHHVALYTVDRTAGAAAQNANGQGWTCFGGTGTQDQNLLGAWAPGSRAVTFPAGTGVPLPASKVVVMQVHYNLQNGVRSPDSTTMKLQYATGPVTQATLKALVDSSFDVPPNAIGYSHSHTFTVSANETVWGVFGHMHTQGHIVNLDFSERLPAQHPQLGFSLAGAVFLHETPKQPSWRGDKRHARVHVETT